MITLTILILALLAVALILLILGGICYIAWPIVLILVIGLFIDIFMIKLLFKKIGGK
jgi:hypothetical protein